LRSWFRGLSPRVMATPFAGGRSLTISGRCSVSRNPSSGPPPAGLASAMVLWGRRVRFPEDELLLLPQSFFFFVGRCSRFPSNKGRSFMRLVGAFPQTLCFPNIPGSSFAGQFFFFFSRSKASDREGSFPRPSTRTSRSFNVRAVCMIAHNASVLFFRNGAF